eukprot:469669_1
MVVTEISFVYFNVGLNFMATVLFVLFFIYAYNERRKIYKRHDTISSFCAERNSWGSRFLLSFTCIVGVNMLCLHVEEFNSRHQEADPFFWIEIAVIFPLPFVGMCYTKGKKYDERDLIEEEFLIDNTRQQDDIEVPRSEMSMQLSYENENEAVDCGFFSFPIWVSEKIHDIAAGIFFGGLTFTNMSYNTVLISNPKHLNKNPPLVISLFIISVINLCVLLIFIIINKIMIGMCHSHGKRLRLWSFVMECLSGALIILLATLNSMKRNDKIGWID